MLIVNIEKTLTEILLFSNMHQRVGGWCEPMQKGWEYSFLSQSCKRASK